MKILFGWSRVYKHFSLVLMLLVPAVPSTSAAEPVPAAHETPMEIPLLIDVRTPQEYQAGYLKGAINIEYEQIVDDVSRLVQDKNRRIELYCRSGRRSGIAQKMLQNVGYKNVVNLGGFEMLLKNYETVYPQKK